MPSPRQNLLKLLPLAAIFCAAPLLRAQNSSAVPAADLPSAPSSVLALEAESLAKPAGSSMVFKAASTAAGPGGAVVELPQSGPLQLSLDDAIALGLNRNLRIVYDRANQREVKGDELGVVNALLPSLTFKAQTETQEINLAALGFKPALFDEIASQLHLSTAGFSTIVKVDTTDVQMSASQQLFNASAYELYQGAKREQAVVDLNALNGRGDLVLAVGTAYLKILADQTTVTNAQAEEASTRLSFSQASDRLQAGVGTSLDNLRAEVQYKQDQQATISAINQLAKDTIQLNRIMGLPAGQQLELTDTAPFAALAALPLDVAKDTAFAHRKDYLSLIAQIDVAQRELRAVKFQRLPVLAFNGYYGVLGQTEGLYHGVFAATGSLRFPIFNEAQQRGQQDQIDAQITNLRQRLASTRIDIEQQIRASMLDVNAAEQLVKVAQSNVELARQELSDERDRFTAGVDTNLPVVDAQASVTGADAQLVNALYQFNVAKLNLARNTGVVETRYRSYLGK